MQLPLRMSKFITETFKTCNKQFDYSISFNPRRPITKPSAAMGNDGWDNENADLILHVKDVLVSTQGNRCACLV